MEGLSGVKLPDGKTDVRKTKLSQCVTLRLFFKGLPWWSSG